MDRIWTIYCDAARIVSWGFGAQIHALVLMNNHYHMLLSTPEGNIDEIMMHFQREISRHVTRVAKEQRYRFQSRYKWELIQSPIQYSRTYLYVANNPVEAGLCENCLDYPYSTIPFEVGLIEDSCPVSPCANLGELIPECPLEKVDWLCPAIKNPNLSLRSKANLFEWKKFKIITPRPPFEIG